MTSRLVNINLNTLFLFQIMLVIWCFWQDVGCSGCGMFEMRDVWNFECFVYAILGIWDVRDFRNVRCSGCGTFGKYCFRDVECSRCPMFGMQDVQDVECSGCEMFGMWNVRDVGCLKYLRWGLFGTWDAVCSVLVYKTPFIKSSIVSIRNHFRALKSL